MAGRGLFRRIQHGLVDEFHLFINPAAIGGGMSIFNNLSGKQALKLVKAIPFACGIVVLNYVLPEVPR